MHLFYLFIFSHDVTAHFDQVLSNSKTILFLLVNYILILGDQPAGGEHSRVDISNEHCKSDVQVFKDVESSPFKPTVQDLHIEPISFNNTAPNQHDTTVNANATAHVDQRRHNNKIIEQSHHLTELNTQHVFSNNTINEKKTLADSNVDYNTDSHLRQLDQALFLPTKQSTFLKTDGVSLNARQSKEKQQPQSHHKLTQPMQPLHPLDIISSVKSIKDAPLTQLGKSIYNLYFFDINS